MVIDIPVDWMELMRKSDESVDDKERKWQKKSVNGLYWRSIFSLASTGDETIKHTQTGA